MTGTNGVVTLPCFPTAASFTSQVLGGTLSGSQLAAAAGYFSAAGEAPIADVLEGLAHLSANGAAQSDATRTLHQKLAELVNGNPDAVARAMSLASGLRPNFTSVTTSSVASLLVQIEGMRRDPEVHRQMAEAGGHIPASHAGSAHKKSAGIYLAAGQAADGTDPAAQSAGSLVDNLVIGGRRVADWTIGMHTDALDTLGAHIYRPFHGVLVTGAGSKPYMIRVKMQLPDGSVVDTEVVDALACYSAVPFGHGDPVITGEEAAYVRRMATVPRSIAHSYLGPWLVALQEYTGMDMFHFKSGGTEANEAAIKAIRKWARRYGGADGKGIPNTEVPIILSAKNAFHGRGFGSTALMDDGLSREDIGPMLPGFEHIPYNDLDAIEEALQRHGGKVAALFIEPIQAEAGVFVPAPDYLRRAQELCKRYNALFVLDEIQTGFGRTGANFAWQKFRLEPPDLMTIGKAMGSGILPISCLCGRRDIMELFVPHSEGSTFGGFPHAAFVGLMTLGEYKRRNINAMAGQGGAYLKARLEELKQRHPGVIKEVRGVGLLIGVEIFSQYDGHELSERMLRHGVYAKETHETNVRIAPPLIIDAEGMDAIVAAMEKAIEEMEAK